MKTSKKDFIKKCIDNPGEASPEIIKILAKLHDAKKTSQKVDAVSELLNLSPSTVWQYYSE